MSSTPQDTVFQIPIGQILLQYRTAALVAQRQEDMDVQAIERFNAEVGRSNERVLGVLTDITGHEERADSQAWAAWWTDQQGYAYKSPTSDPKPTIVQDVPLVYIPQLAPINPQVVQSGPTTTTNSVTASNHSCFRAGTVVRTLTGARPIESIAVGDRVLVEDTATGALSYQATLAVFHNRPARLYRIELGDETIWATGIHRFWKAGLGWTMVRDLKPGDVLRTLGNTATVGSVEEGTVEPVYNLEVAGGQSFFVGMLGALVHDNSLVRPVAEPFDASLRGRNEPADEPDATVRN
ncbi:polymorphic toxin-type HINT domain-containing protein [Singulisphaera sp. GP187]|uniref:polymorphic toxin-type HINT domain-containing protein n=1 Tax=Singulisphaera sp. GP187 TaxID=1882752 RepID=UPI0020B16CB1|nr:polymorphic toxin-type HINT domain-containing protein [Singulisphaera sp. GP187]